MFVECKEAQKIEADFGTVAADTVVAGTAGADTVEFEIPAGTVEVLDALVGGIVGTEQGQVAIFGFGYCTLGLRIFLGLPCIVRRPLGRLLVRSLDDH